jgi:2-isopropylmalate synthase
MTKERSSILDTTFRDGAQSPLVETVGLEDSLRCLKLLDELGFDYLEAGFAASNNGDAERIRQALKLGLKAKIAAFGWAAPETVEQMTALNVPVAVLVAKSRKRDVAVSLQRNPEEYLDVVARSVERLVERGIEVILDAEHAFQAINEDDCEFALQLFKRCWEAGARWIVLCDTNGKSSVKLATETIRIAAKAVPLENLGVHFHNDRGRAIALAEVAYQLGIRHIQGVFGGFGERAGNTDLSVLVPNLCQDLGCTDFEPEVLAKFTSAYRKLCEILNIVSDPCHPWVGKDAFFTKAGIHASGEKRDPGSYSHADPGLVGNRASFGLAGISGRANLLIKAAEIGIEIPEDKLPVLAEHYKDLADSGISFERAEASFYLWLLRELNLFEIPLTFVSWQVEDKCFPNKKRDISEVSLVMSVGGEDLFSSACGAGPVNALEKALRHILCERFPDVSPVKLMGFTLKTLGMKKGSAAVVRILCDFTDGNDSWTAIGTDEDFLRSAWQALLDGYCYKLAKIARYRPITT